jgi:glycosyltransferase involved in cell wall biosynthesis
MRVLFISSDFPSDLQLKVHGVYKRMRMFVDAIKQIAQLDILFYVSPELDISQANVAEIEHFLSQFWDAKITLFLCPIFKQQVRLSPLQNYLSRIFSFFKQTKYISTSGTQQVQALDECLSRKPDAVFVHRLKSMCPCLLTRKALPPIFFDLDDIEHIAFTRSLGQPPKKRTRFLSYLQIPALWWGEYRAMRLAKQTFVCSEKDRHYLTQQLKLPGIVCIPNAVTIPNLQPVTDKPTLMFLGSYTYLPNVNAAEFLIEEVWPHIYQVMPEAQLIIAGGSPNKIRNYSTGVSGVEFTDFVSDLDILYQRSRVVCCPILSGGGTRIKILEAAAYGKPIVSTKIGSEGIEMNDGQEILLRDEAKLFAQACLDLLKNSALCEQLGLAAREVVIHKYNRDRTLQLIQQYIKT